MIDFSVLRDLTDQDLKDLGVVLDDRRKLLRSIGALNAGSRQAPATSTGRMSQDAAERRQVATPLPPGFVTAKCAANPPGWGHA